jgi:hypothetical protein
MGRTISKRRVSFPDPQGVIPQRPDIFRHSIQRPRHRSYAPNGRALGMKRHLAVVRCSETSGGGKILFNNVFMSLVLRVGWRTSGNCSSSIRAVVTLIYLLEFWRLGSFIFPSW